MRTLFDGLGQGCVAVAMSHDARFVATVSMGVPQVQLYIHMVILCVCVCVFYAGGVCVGLDFWGRRSTLQNHT